ncbi:hypothetical protein SAMN05421505_14010 [Sinosporangium album]|uniref:Uncharacterized protein n=1 Tax=Sinosporangium album TaxID=504805 RepID=A0A1G8IZZ1_9ACTN|nr:hypothetical protein [Sinosporangium album]SDI24030.1 hypothetical protein SAMN05421505_14010 [Sinosporangium album]
MTGGSKPAQPVVPLPQDRCPLMGPVHSQKAQLRAIENGYSMIRQAEFGVAGAFDGPYPRRS